MIYDAHEDLPRDILFKRWIPHRLRGPVSRVAAAVEWVAARTLSGVVAATRRIARRFPTGRVALVQNFAWSSEFTVDDALPRHERRGVAYVGNVSPERCAVEMVEAIAQVERFPEVRLIIAGPISSPALKERLVALKGWARVDYRGYQPRPELAQLLMESSVGLAVLQPTPSFVDSQPVKMFEYMAAGLPDFPRFREIIEETGCTRTGSPQRVH